MSTHTTNGTAADVQAKINAAGDGDDVTLPPGKHVWQTGITINKAVRLRGAGAGRVVARIAALDWTSGVDVSMGAVTVGTGLKDFVLKVERVASVAALRSEITAGRTLRLQRLGMSTVDLNQLVINNEPWMEGTVVSLNGDTLTMNITATNGSGTHPMWTVSTMAATTIINDTPASDTANPLLDITESSAGSVEVSGIRFAHSTGNGSYFQRRDFVRVQAGTNGQPALLHDLYFDEGSYCINVEMVTNRGIIWNCSFNSQVFAMGAEAIRINVGGDGSPAALASWGTASTMGTADTTGKSNVYIENCDFNGFLTAIDLENGSRTTMRHVLFNNSGLGSHGADTSPIGLRHFELYDFEFSIGGYSSVGFAQSVNIYRMIWIRGGTGVITDGTIPHSAGWDYYENQTSIHLSVLNLNRYSGPNPHWGKDIPGIQYPCPRQVGFGRVTGTGKDGIGRTVDSTGAYVGDREPIYIWNITSTAPDNPYNLKVFGEGTGAGEDDVLDYIQHGREFFHDGTAKPGWQKFPHPHPLRAGSTNPEPQPVPTPEPEPQPAPEPTPVPVPQPERPSVTVSPVSASVKKGGSVTFVAAATGSTPLAYVWRGKNGAVMTGRTQPTLTLASVGPGMAGTYSVTVSNAAGQATANATLAVTNR